MRLSIDSNRPIQKTWTWLLHAKPVWTGVIGMCVALIGPSASGSQMLTAEKIVVIGVAVPSDTASDLAAIGGTHARAIGGTHAKAIGGTHAKAIGGTHARAIGGTHAKAIGGTHAKASSGSQLMSIGETDLQAIGGTYLRGMGAANLIGADTGLNQTPDLRNATVNFMGEEYNWVLVGPLSSPNADSATLLGYAIGIPGNEELQGIADSQRMIVVANRHSDDATVAFATDDSFISGVTPVVVAARIASIDAATARIALQNGVTVDYSPMLANGVEPNLSEGDLILVQGQLY